MCLTHQLAPHCQSRFTFLWFSLENCLLHVCKAGGSGVSLSAKERSQSRPCHCRGTGWLCGAYLEAPEPPDVLAPLKAGRLQPLIQAAFQGAQARGTSTDDSYSPGSHVPRCGGGRDAGEAVARSKTH